MQPIVEIYTSALCGYCSAAKRLLNARGIAYHEIDTTFSPTKRKIMTERANGKTSVPQIFIDGVAIGGCDDLYELDAAGQLEPLINPK
jgi:glutaredoxin 3